MRTRLVTYLVLGGMWSILSAVAAQGGEGFFYVPSQVEQLFDDSHGVVPAGYEVNYGTGRGPVTQVGGYHDPMYGGGMPGGYGETYPGPYPGGQQFGPYPHVSPYEHSYDHHRYDVNSGAWFNDVNNNTRQYNGGFEVLLYRLRKPGSNTIGYQSLGFGGAFDQVRDLTAIQENLETVGIQPYWGWTDPDDTGFRLSGAFYGSPDQDADFRGRVDPAFIPVLNTDTNQLIVNPAGNFVFNGGIGASYNAAAWGAEAEFYTTPVLGRANNKVRGIFGMRYLGVREALRVTAVHSQRGTALIQSQTRSNLVGPETGLRWDMGGEAFKLTLFGKIGMFANFDRNSIHVVNFNQTSNDVDIAGTHVSPMTEFGLLAEFPLFSYTPFINRIPVVRDARFQFGWTHTSVYVMSRPADSILWSAPTIGYEDNRNRWSMHGFHFNMMWEW